MQKLLFVDNNITPLEFLNKAIAYTFLAAFLLTIVYVFYGGFKFIFSGGDEAKIKGATNTIRHAIIGLIIVFMAVFVVSIIGKIFGLDILGTLLNFDDIFANIKGIVDRLGSSGSSTIDTSSTSIRPVNLQGDF